VPIASLGFRTDVMLRALMGAEVHEDGDVTVVRTPAIPDFWWGNFVLVAAGVPLDRALAAFARAFPDAAHVAIGVDGTDGAPGVDDDARRHRLLLERSTVLSAAAVRPPPRPDATATYRRLATDDDFAQAVALQQASEPDTDAGFTARRLAAYRRLQEAGRGAWFGAFVDGRMRSGLGVFTDGRGVARYQTVDTHPDFRGRGLAGTLVHRAGAEALTWPGVDRLVIAADPEYHAIRVYRSVGLAGTETQVQLLRPPGRRAD
jgi:GNAT superfamily N-acetyltransferase